MLLKVKPAVDAPLHSVWLDTAATPGVGLTVIVKPAGAPMQLLADGVTVMVPVMADDVVLVAVKADIFPLPLDARPIEEALFVQL